MRPTRPLQRHCSAAVLTLLFTAISAYAALEHRAKKDGAMLYGDRFLEPPPLTILHEGQWLEMVSKGSNASLVETETGIRGWVRNEDLVAVKISSRDHSLRDQEITSDGIAISPNVWIPRVPKVKVEDLERSFADEVVETVDREQLEMRNDEN